MTTTDKPTPISPPTAINTAPTASTADEEPSQPLSPLAPSFEHKTSGVVPPVRPFITVDTPAINDTPIELDSGELSIEDLEKRAKGEKLHSPGLGEDEDIAEEFLGEGGGKAVGRELREKRKVLLESRSKDPGVIVDVPQEPTAEEVLAAKSAEGMVTPGLVGREFDGEVAEQEAGR